MAAQKTDEPSWVKAFESILKLEESHGFDDKAVMGGLDRFVERWSVEMASRALKDAKFLLEESYDSMSRELRARWVAEWLEALSQQTDPNQRPRVVTTPRQRNRRQKTQKQSKLPPTKPFQLMPQSILLSTGSREWTPNLRPGSNAWI